MALGKILTEMAPANEEVLVFTEVETYALADIAGQKGWFLHPSYPNPNGRQTVVGGSIIEGVQSISLKARAGAGTSTFTFRELTTPVIWPYARMEFSWKFKMLSTLTVPYADNINAWPFVPANPNTSFDGVMFFAPNGGVLGKVEMWVGSHLTSLWEALGYNDDTVHSYKWVVISQGDNEPALNEFYVDNVLVASRIGGGGSFNSPSLGDIPNSFSHISIDSSMNNDVANADKMFYDSIQIKVTR